MNAMIFAAGMGTRLRPLTNSVPKALVKVGGRSLLERVIDKLRESGFECIVVNVHHLKEQIVEYLRGTDIRVSVEEELLDTGGGLKRALPYFDNCDPILLHNVDIVSNVDLRAIYDNFDGRDLAHLVVSERATERQLLFDDDMRLVGWTNTKTGEVRSVCEGLVVENCRRYAFAGIHCVRRDVEKYMSEWGERFSIIDFYLKEAKDVSIRGVVVKELRLIDVGKMETLAQAEQQIMGQ